MIADLADDIDRKKQFLAGVEIVDRGRPPSRRVIFFKALEGFGQQLVVEQVHRLRRRPMRTYGGWFLTAQRLTVRQEWQTTRHGGKVEFTIDEFFAHQGAPQEALMALLFERVPADA